MPENGITQKHTLKFIREHNGRRTVQKEAGRDSPTALPPGRLPRVTKLMALAIRFEHLLTTRAVTDQAQLAELGHVSRARITQIMNLLHLAPDIQEQILFLPRISQGRDVITERHLRPIIRLLNWNQQRQAWARLSS
ncbi:MAG: hypothetical protein GWP14_05920 [Actinobacteria bacterium]|nr:hypothetical protein [Actinomycetota bacterium]